MVHTHTHRSAGLPLLVGCHTHPLKKTLNCILDGKLPGVNYETKQLTKPAVFMKGQNLFETVNVTKLYFVMSDISLTTSILSINPLAQ
jgi:hypothetical protein